MPEPPFDHFDTPHKTVIKTKLHSGLSVWQLLAIFFLMQSVVAFFTYYHSLTFDEAMWNYIGRNWFRHGMVPYTGGVDNKSPLIFMVFGLSDKLFGVNFWFPRILGIFFQTAGIYYVFKITKNLSGPAIGKLACSIYGLSLLWHASGGKYVSYTEAYSVASIAAAFYYAQSSNHNRSMIIAGILAGLGSVFRLTAFFGTAAILVMLLLKKKNSFFIFFLSSIAAITIFILVFYLLGIQPNQLFENLLVDNFSGGSVTDHSMTSRVDNFVVQFFNSEMVIFLPGLIGYLFFSKPDRSILLWLLFEFVGISVIGTYANQHFKCLLPALSIITALFAGQLIDKSNSKTAYNKATLVIWLIFFPKLTEPIQSIKKLFTAAPTVHSSDGAKLISQPGDDARKLLGLWIKSHTNETDKVLVVGYGAQIQAYSERISPTIYFNVTQTERAQRIFFEELKANKAEMILVPGFQEYTSLVNASIRTFVSDMVTREYRYEQCLYGYNIYRKY